MDRYTKIILTVIALLLALNLLAPYINPSTVAAFNTRGLERDVAENRHRLDMMEAEFGMFEERLIHLEERIELLESTR
jgi:hypothetical protein